MILTNLATEQLSFIGPVCGPFDEKPRVADALSCYEQSLGVHTVQDVAKAFAQLANQIFIGNKQVVDKNLGEGMIHGGSDRTNIQFVAPNLAHVYKEDGQAFGLFFDFIQRSCARKKQHQIGVLTTTDIKFMPIYPKSAVDLFREGSKFGGIGSGVLFGYAKNLQSELTGSYFGEIPLLLVLIAVFEQGSHDVHLSVTGTPITAGRLNLFHNHGSFTQRATLPSIRFWNQG